MLGSRAQNLNQENPLHSRQFPTKTPLRQQAGPSKGLTTGGKGLGGGAGLRQTTGKANRVLGQKDHNLGKASTGQFCALACSRGSS